MAYQIKNIDGEIIHEHGNTAKECLEDGVKKGINFRRANLAGANLWNTIGNSEEIISAQTNKYSIAMTKDIIYIGCKGRTLEEWISFSDYEISEMDDGALEWWNKYKGFTVKMYELNYGGAK